MANNAVTAPKIASSAVTTSKIGNKQVTAAKIADGTITATQIAAGVIPSGGTGPTISGDISLSQLPDGTVIGLSRDANNNLLVRRVADAEENDYSDSTISLGPGIKYNWTINTPPLGTQEQQNARKLGDIYIVSNQNDMYVWAQDALGKRWERVSEPVIAAGSINASQLRASARTFIQAASPGGRAERGVFWVDTDADNKLWVRGQNDWIEVAAKAAAPETGLTGPRVARYTGEMTLRQVGTYVRTGAGWIMGPATFTPSIGSGIHDLEISLVRRAAGAQTTHLLSAFIDTSDLAAMTNNTSEAADLDQLLESPGNPDTCGQQPEIGLRRRRRQQQRLVRLPPHRKLDAVLVGDQQPPDRAGHLHLRGRRAYRRAVRISGDRPVGGDQVVDPRHQPADRPHVAEARRPRRQDRRAPRRVGRAADPPRGQDHQRRPLMDAYTIAMVGTSLVLIVALLDGAIS